MKLINLSEKKYLQFYEDHQYKSFFNSLEIGQLKKASKDEVHYVGLVRNDKILAAAMLIATKTILNKKSFYAPRGPLIDYDNVELLNTFTKALKKYIKQHNGFRLIIDPTVIYQKRNNDGSLIETEKPYDKAIINLKNAGFKHFGFNQYFETSQVRYVSRLDLEDDYETLFNKFSKSTKKNIISSYEKGLRIEVGTKEDLKTMRNLFSETANRREFKVSELDYYYQLYEYAQDLMKVYLAHLDPKIYLQSVRDQLSTLNETKLELLEKAKMNKVGRKLEQQIATNERQIKRLEEEQLVAEQFKKDYPEGKYIAGLLSIKSGDEYITLTSGSLKEYFKFTPKYLLYSEHIKDAFLENFKYVNFYGVSGNFNKENNPYYGIFEVKRGFNTYVLEYIGQFTLEVTLFNKLFNLLRLGYRVIKKILK